jgi:8-amino-7-oxononanoate synthase
MSAFDAKLTTRLAARKAEHLYRTRRVQDSPQQPEVVSDGKRLLAFSSNDYLGLANHPELIAAFKRGLNTYGVGGGASHLVAGHSRAHHELEEELAAFTGRSRALVFSSGFMANVGVLAALASKQDLVFEDRLNHASLLDGGLNSGAAFKRYPHLDMAKLAAGLASTQTQGQRFIVSDGVFSMDGDVAPLGDLLTRADQHEAVVMLDDAHGFGCLGSKGGGLVEAAREQGVDTSEARLAVLVGTFGKAFGTAGAFVTGSEALIETLIQFCRPYIYTTAMPPALAEATRCSLRLVQQEAWRRAHLKKLITQFRAGCAELKLPLTDSHTPIQGLLLGAAETALEFSQQLEQRGILVGAIRPPTVPPGTARLRISFSAAHTAEQVTRLLDALAEIAPTVLRDEAARA